VRCSFSIWQNIGTCIATKSSIVSMLIVLNETDKAKVNVERKSLSYGQKKLGVQRESFSATIPNGIVEFC
jgi:hypothetical protein